MANKAAANTTKKKTSKIPKDKYFWVVDGTVIRSVRELAEAIDTMDYNIFQHHVCNGRNDFATWLEDVFEEKNLGRELRESPNKDRVVICILKHLVRK
jgi:hypothetical protein